VIPHYQCPDANQISEWGMGNKTKKGQHWQE